MDLRGRPYLIAEPARLGGRDALGDGGAGEKSGGSEESGGETEEWKASVPPPDRLHRARTSGRAGPRRKEECMKDSDTLPSGITEPRL